MRSDLISLLGSVAGTLRGSFAGATRMHARTDAEVRAMYQGLEASDRVVVAEDLVPLPAPVRRWLERSGVVGRPIACAVRLRQSGEMHTSSDAAWFPVKAEQYFTTADPGFIWWMEGRMRKILPLAGRDKYTSGSGEMHVRAAGLFDVALGRGPKIDEGALLRWLAEIIWFPSAALRTYIAWQAIDDLHARATVTSHGITATAAFNFDAEGRAVALDAERWFGADGPREHWSGRSTEWQTIRGVEVPTRGEVIWHLKTGDFTFFRWRVTDVETGRPFPYADKPASEDIR